MLETVDVPNNSPSIGSVFLSGNSRIGRKRLPEGVFAHLGDPKTLALAIHDLYKYAVQPSPAKDRYAIVYKIVTEQDRDAINYKIREFFGSDSFAAISADFCPPVDHFHMIDSEHVAHVFNRHSNEAAEFKRGHLPVVACDFELLPLAVLPKNIHEFQMTGDSPRIIYVMNFERARLVVVEEFSKKRGLCFKTMYKQKK